MANFGKRKVHQIVNIIDLSASGHPADPADTNKDFYLPFDGLLCPALDVYIGFIIPDGLVWTRLLHVEDGGGTPVGTPEGPSGPFLMVGGGGGTGGGQLPPYSLPISETASLKAGQKCARVKKLRIRFN